jgi:hypothetical protein
VNLNPSPFPSPKSSAETWIQYPSASRSNRLRTRGRLLVTLVCGGFCLGSKTVSRFPQHHRSPAELPTEERNDQPRPRISAFAAQHHTNLNINKIPPPETPPSCTHRAIMAGRFVRASKYRQQCSSPDERHEIRLTAGQDMFLGSRRGRNLAMTTCTLVATRGIPIW